MAGNMTPQKAHNHTIEDLVDSEGEESPVTEVRRMMIRMFNELKVELKEDIQKQFNESQENTGLKKKNLKKTQKQLNEIKEDANKPPNETKEIILKRR
jgi:hypothetical protein